MCKWVLLLAILPLMLAGCAKYWYQEGKTFDECQQARDECFAELKKRTDFSHPTVEYEIQFMNECMQSKGYREIKNSEIPLDAKRQEPETTLHWRARGLAGSVK